MWNNLKIAACGIIVGVLIITYVQAYRAAGTLKEAVTVINELVERDREKHKDMDSMYAQIGDLEAQSLYTALALANTNSEMLKALDLSDNDNILYIYFVYKPLLDRLIARHEAEGQYLNIKQAVQMWIVDL